MLNFAVAADCFEKPVGESDQAYQYQQVVTRHSQPVGGNVPC